MNALQIFFYFDVLEVVNPIGLKTKTHKLGIYVHMSCYTPCLMVSFLPIGTFYFTVGYLSTKYRSQLSSIHLVKAVFISNYGMDAVLKPIIDDIKKMQYACYYYCNYDASLIGTRS